MISGARYSGVPQNDWAKFSSLIILARPKSVKQRYPKIRLSNYLIYQWGYFRVSDLCRLYFDHANSLSQARPEPHRIEPWIPQSVSFYWEDWIVHLLAQTAWRRISSNHSRRHSPLRQGMDVSPESEIKLTRSRISFSNLVFSTWS